MVDAKKEEVHPCPDGHDAAHAMYLTTAYTPHVKKPAVLSVAVHMFLCRNCGRPYATHQEVPRGYLPDGTISSEMQAELQETRIMAEVDQRLKLIMQMQQEKQNQAAARAVQGATKEGGKVHGTSDLEPGGAAPEAGGAGS